ncbi:MAG: GNAT family N-acetyltransferase [Alphaproteobacteria bacterium]|nr:GNAT family N-acetyltransferase [Alphaproteobacteria bacterium]
MFNKMHCFLKLIFLLIFSSIQLQSSYLDARTINLENNRGVVELAKLTASGGGQLIEEDWGVMTKANPKYTNVGFDFIFITKKVNDKKVKEIISKSQKFYKKTFFEVWIDKENKEHCKTFEDAGFERRGDFPAKFLLLDKDFDDFSQSDVVFKKVKTDKELVDWATVTALVYALDKERLLQFGKMAVIQPNVVLYIAYHENVPVSTRIMLAYGKTVTGYFSATLPHYRRRGIASALLRRSLNDARKNGATLFVNQAAPNSAIVWQKMGMHDYDNAYICYAKKS